jgi:hypothetical protein
LFQKRAAAPLVAVLFTGLSAGVAGAQTLANPDISVIGDMRAIARTDEAASAAGAGNLSFVFEEIEFNFAGYLNPYMRADVTAALHGEEVEVELEEANFTVLRGLPWSLQFNAGRYLLDFGRLNSQHPHQWAWMDTPLVIRTMLGEEGLRATGGRLTMLTGAGETAVTLSASAFMSDAFAAHEHGQDDGHEHEAAEEDAAPEVMGSSRVSLFRQLSDAWSFEAGGSYMAGTYDPVEALWLDLAGADLKLRWRPDTYRSFVWIAEMMSGTREVAAEDSPGISITETSSTGAFTSVQYQFRMRWDLGGFVDWTQDAVAGDAETTAAGAFFGFSPAEETARISLVYRHETSDFYDHEDNSLTLQFLWSLGPHKVHTF